MSNAIQATGSLIAVSDAGGDAPVVFARSVPSLTGLSSTGSWRTATGGVNFSGASGWTDAKAISDDSDDAPEVFAGSVPSLTCSSSTRFWRTATGSETFNGALGSTDAEAASARSM